MVIQVKSVVGERELDLSVFVIIIHFYFLFTESNPWYGYSIEAGGFTAWRTTNIGHI